jgi:hypothetical protein
MLCSLSAYKSRLTLSAALCNTAYDSSYLFGIVFSAGVLFF